MESHEIAWWFKINFKKLNLLKKIAKNCVSLKIKNEYDTKKHVNLQVSKFELENCKISRNFFKQNFEKSKFQMKSHKIAWLFRINFQISELG